MWRRLRRFMTCALICLDWQDVLPPAVSVCETLRSSVPWWPRCKKQKILMRIIEALREHSCELSERTMTDHILAGKARLMARVKEEGLQVSDTGTITPKE